MQPHIRKALAEAPLEIPPQRLRQGLPRSQSRKGPGPVGAALRAGTTASATRSLTHSRSPRARRNP